MHKKTISYHSTMWIILMMVVAVTGCGSSVPHEATSSPLPTLPPDTSEQPEAALAVPASPLLTPAPDPDWGTVTGRLVDAIDGEPVQGVMVFLEPATPEHTVPAVLYAPPNNQPRAFSDEGGYFVVPKVSDGEYAAILFSPPFALQVVTHPDGDRPQLLTVHTGEVVDVGTVKVQEFELP